MSLSLSDLIEPAVLKKRRQFLKVASTKCAVVTPYLILQYSVEERDCAPPVSPWFVGFTASRKVGKAVQRNFAKRRLREIVRLYAKDPSLPHVFFEGDGYVLHTVLIARKSLLTANFSNLQASFERAMGRVLKSLTPHQGEG